MAQAGITESPVNRADCAFFVREPAVKRRAWTLREKPRERGCKSIALAEFLKLPLSFLCARRGGASGQCGPKRSLGPRNQRGCNGGIFL